MRQVALEDKVKDSNEHAFNADLAALEQGATVNASLPVFQWILGGA